MTNNSDIVFPAAARRAQAERGSARVYDKKIAAGYPDRVTPDLAGFIAALDTAFLATVSAEGAPYIQHRGGPKGFIKVLDDKTLGFADFAGNKQYITISNLAGNDRAYLFLLDFANRQRIKVWGRARVVENDPALMERLVDPGYRARPGARDPVHHRGLGRELLAAHHRAIHPRRKSPVRWRGSARAHRRAGSRERPAARRAGSHRRAINGPPVRGQNGKRRPSGAAKRPLPVRRRKDLQSLIVIGQYCCPNW